MGLVRTGAGDMGRGDGMTREDVIKGLEQFIADFKPFCGNKADWQRVYDALALLKEQEPRTVSSIIKVHECTLGKCPTCGAELMDYYNEEHCGICGQAVKWDG